MAGTGQQGGEQAAGAAGAEDGHGERMRHGVVPFDGRPRESVAAFAVIIAGRGARRETEGMCRSIKTLRPPVLPGEATDDDIRAAALQYVRKVSGFRTPAAHNREAFDAAVDAVARATAELLGALEVRGRAGPK
ncbi:hypothetical protein Srubr_78250 [Streptomyces rubradiris]|uniref:DUF2277 domain-containing protein n=2 Tax=Streptomyces TaxID=1883 RepID=A0ABQ3RQ57_STRRR|nr:hypothetical protein GCM10018792_48270 [Streptomyces rubradiris]GHI57979.1 hypothetical protein Srubr_78250 [Streptomyces rubradiris]